MVNGSCYFMCYVVEIVYGQILVIFVFKFICYMGIIFGLFKEFLQFEEICDDCQIVDFCYGVCQVGGDINFEFLFGSFDDLLEVVILGIWVVDGVLGGDGDCLKVGMVCCFFIVECFFGDIVMVDKLYYCFIGVELNILVLVISVNVMIIGIFGMVGLDMFIVQVIIVGVIYVVLMIILLLDLFIGILNENGMLIVVIIEIQLNLENGLEVCFVVGFKKLILLFIGWLNVLGIIMVYFENFLLLDKFINEIEFLIVFEFLDGVGNKYVFILFCIKYNGGQLDVEGEGLIILSMLFQVFLDSVIQFNIIIDKVFV